MKYFKYAIYLFLVSFYIACTPKVAEVVQVEEKEVPKQEITDNPCTTLDEVPPAMNEEVLNSFVLYRDAIKANDFENARKLWKVAFYGAPAANGRVTYQFDDGIKIYTHYYNLATTDAQKSAIVDTIELIYNKRIECFGDEAYNLGRKAFDYYYTFQGQKTEDEIFEMFRKAADEKGDKLDYFTVNPFTKLLYDRIVRKEIDREIGRKYAMNILKSVENGLATCGNKCESWDIINDYSPKRLEALEGFADFYPCDYYEKKYFPIYEANQDDCDIISEIYRKLKWGKCDPSSLALSTLKSAKETKCYTPPPPPGYLKQGYEAYNDGDFKGAISFFEKYINEKTEDPLKKAKYELLIAKIYYGDLKDFIKSRKHAKKAASHRANWGEPYILIGKLYASSGPLCGPGRGWDSQIVTWPAIDKFQYAKKIDPSVSAEANKWINTYKQYMPSKGDIFQRSLKEGGSFKVGCWIQESTTIRAAN